MHRPALTANVHSKFTMPIPDKVAAAKKINEFLQSVVSDGGLRLKYRITVDPPLAEQRDWEKPEILVEFAGPDSTLLLDRGGELLRSLEFLAQEILHLAAGEHEKISFDCQNQRSIRLQELRMAATVAAENVRRTGTPYHFAPMSSRERRIVHLALREEMDLLTESDGEGPRRCVVVYPKDYKPAAGGRPARRAIP
jgi:spoIIIJ-associated protein